MTIARLRRVLPATLVFVLGWTYSSRGALPKVPEGFEARLVATVPAVMFPSQVATAPDGALFVAEDPMDQVGPFEANHGRILLFRDGKDPVVYASGFRAIQGMAWHDGSLYVSHMPFLSVIRDADGDDKAESRKDLFKDLGPTNNRGLNDHIVSGIQFGIDGYLYISVGDKGIPKATGPDGRTIQIIGGGTCRCRPDGTGLEVVSNGTRNHLEVNLDDRDSLFTYDNTDDGLGWWTRVTYHVDGGYYGYPYDYHGRPDRHLPRIAEYGGGSPCGGVVYKEDVWPEQYRNAALWAEWGKGKVHGFRFARDGATFKVAEAIDFAVPNGVENFRPIDLALSYDGRTLYIADWGLSGWASSTEKVGRVFAITYKGQVKTRPRGRDTDSIEAQIRELDHPSFSERMRAQAALIKKGREALTAVTAALAAPGTDPVARRHLIWALDGIAGGTPQATTPLVAALDSPEADVRAQAARALGERAVPEAVEALIARLTDADPSVRLQTIIALGRIKKARAIPALEAVLADKDDYLAFSARVALRRIGDWKAASQGLKAADPKVRGGVLAALELVYEPAAAALLADFARDPSREISERARALSYLAQVHRKARPWDGKWWGTRPADGKPPAKVESWAGTALVLDTIRGLVSDAAAPVRLAAVSAVKETGDRESLAPLRDRFTKESDIEVKTAIAKTLGALDDKQALDLLIAAVRSPGEAETVRTAALASIETIGTDAAIKALVALLEQGALGLERQPQVIAALGRFKARAAVAPLSKALKSPAPAVRAAAAEALGKIGRLQGVDVPLRKLLEDPELSVRRAAITALGALEDRESIPALVAASDVDATRFEAIKALADMPDLLALQVYLRGLGDKSPDIRKAAAEAIGEIRAQAAPVLEQLAKRHEVPPSVVPELRKVYTTLQPVHEWRVVGPFKIDDKPPFSIEGTIDLNASYVGSNEQPAVWKSAKSVDKKGQVNFGKVYTNLDDRAAYGYAEVTSNEPRQAQAAVGSDDTLTVWVNGKQVYDFQNRRGYDADKDRFDVPLVKGVNRILIKCGNRGGGWQYSLALASSSDYAFLKGPATGGFNPDAFRDFALKSKGKASHGRALFQDLKGLACIKCHSVGTEGGKVGPELSSVGAKYPRAELIASVLFPSARIQSGYEPVVLATADGRILTGILKSESPEALEIEDADAKRIRIPKEDVEARKRSDVSLMPNGLAEGLTRQDFADLIAYLETLKEPPPKQPVAGGASR